MTPWVRLGRAAAGLCLGWAWSSMSSLIWVGAASAWFGDLDTALRQLKGEWWGHAGLAGCLGSALGSWAGGVAGPAALGRCRLRSPILCSSILGGGLGAVLSGSVGALVGWLVWRPGVSKMAFNLPLVAGLVVGLMAGAVAALLLTHCYRVTHAREE